MLSALVLIKLMCTHVSTLCSIKVPPIPTHQTYVYVLEIRFYNRVHTLLAKAMSGCVDDDVPHSNNVRTEMFGGRKPTR